MSAHTVTPHSSRAVRTSWTAVASISVFLASFSVLVGACGGEATPSESPVAAVVVTPSATEVATAVERRLPTATPTATPDPLSVATSRVIPGMPVPYGAELAGFSAPNGNVDSLAKYRMDADAATLSAWFLDQMPKAGWNAGEERDGALIFEHTTQKSVHEGAEGPDPRTATILFGGEEGIAFAILAEAAR